MDQLDKEEKTASIAGMSVKKSSKRSRKRNSNAGKMDGDQVIKVVLASLQEAGYEIEPVNFEDSAGNVTACLKLTGKVWTTQGELIKVQV